MCFLNLCCNRYNLYSNQIKNEDIDLIDFQNLIIFDDVYMLNEIIDISMLIKPDVIVVDFVQNINTFATGYEAMASIAK